MTESDPLAQQLLSRLSMDSLKVGTKLHLSGDDFEATITITEQDPEPWAMMETTEPKQETIHVRLLGCCPYIYQPASEQRLEHGELIATSQLLFLELPGAYCLPRHGSIDEIILLKNPAA